MKKIVAVAAFAAVAAAATFSYAGMGARTGVNGSFHDMNYYGSNFGNNGVPDNYDRVCVFCHTPHNATVIDEGSTLDDGRFLPLWGRNFGTNAQLQLPYQWATPANAAEGVAEVVDPLVGPSRLCTSCHDGSIAVDGHISNGAYEGNIKLNNKRGIGSDASPLMNTHPIGFDYVTAKEKRNNPTTTVGGATGYNITEIIDENEGFATAITPNQVLGSTDYNTVTRGGNRAIKTVLYNGRIMTCASCHEVHNKENAAPSVAGHDGTYPNFFLYAEEKDSLICLSCHQK